MSEAAPYNLDTIKRIKAFAQAGHGVHAVARELCWMPDTVRRLAKRHAIELTEDNADSRVEYKAPREPAWSLEPLERQTRGAKPGTKFIRRRRGPHPRTRYITVAISEAGLAGIASFANPMRLSSAGVAGLSLDYAARHGHLKPLFDDARAEFEEPA